jgi:nucleoside-diphosphate-sugar epimerase
MARILVTGAAGFTGRYLGPRMAADGHQLFGLTQGDAGEVIPGFAGMFACDLNDHEGLARVVAEVKPTKVAHLAAIAFVAHGDVAEMYSTNILGSRTLLGVLAEAEVQPDAVLMASSANIYGNGASGVIEEGRSPAPANDYGVTKLAMEQVATIFADRLPITIVRPFNYTGVGQGVSFLIPKIVDAVRRKAPVLELGNLDVSRDFSDVRAVVDAYARLLVAEGAAGQTVNVCSGRAVALGAVIEMVKQISGHDFEVRVNPAFVRPDEVKTLCGSRARLEAIIGDVAMPPLDATLRWMIEG